MKKHFNLFTSIGIAVLVWGMSFILVLAATPVSTVNSSATLAYNIKGLQHNFAVQKAYIGATYVYVTQREGSTCYLSRLLVSGNDANYLDEMTITNAGHCQTLDSYAYNGENYFYFSSKADPSTTYNWSLQVARIQYSPGVTYNYTNLHRFTYMNYANKTGARLGDTYRVDGGGNSSYTIFRVQTTNGDVTWSIYDTNMLNQLLDNNMQVQMNDPQVINACITSFTQSGSSIVRPNNSFQGHDMIGKTRIFTSGGKSGQIPGIAKMSNTGVYQTLVNITNVGAHEIEGVQLKDNNVYFTIVPDPVNKQNTQKIYYVPESIF